MKEKTYIEQTVADYISSNLEHRDVFEMDKYTASIDKGYKYSNLKKSDTLDKMPLAYYKDKQGDLRVCFTPNTHRLTIGSTGAGKSTFMVQPDIKTLSKAAVQPDMFIIDVKGELYRDCSPDLIADGYDVFVLNFKDSRNSHSYNYLSSIIDDIDLKTFATLKTTEQNYIRLEAQAKINNLVANIITVANRDPYWDLSAQELVSGMLCWMLEMYIDGTVIYDQFNVKTLYEITNHCISKASRGSSFQLKDIKELEPYKEHSFYNSLKSSFENADTTRACIFGVTKTKLKGIFSSKSFALSYASSFEATQGDKPKAVFVIINAMDDAEFDFCRIVIDDFYSKLIKQAGKLSRERLPRPMHYFLDEFGNINKIANFQKKMALARSYNIFFHLFIQSYAQLGSVYEQDTGTIINNCLTQVFLSCSDYSTCEVYAKECGKKTIKTLEAELDPQKLEHSVVNCVPISRLLDMRLGQACIRRKGEPVLFARLLASWGEKEFEAKGESVFPKNALTYDETRYCYKLDIASGAKTKKSFDFDFNFGDDDDEDEEDCDCETCKPKDENAGTSDASSPKKRKNFFDFLNDDDKEDVDKEEGNKDDDFGSLFEEFNEPSDIDSKENDFIESEDSVSEDGENSLESFIKHIVENKDKQSNQEEKESKAKNEKAIETLSKITKASEEDIKNMNIAKERFASFEAYISVQMIEAEQQKCHMHIDFLKTDDSVVDICIRKGKDGFYFTDEGSCYKELNAIFKMEEEDVINNLHRIAKQFNATYNKGFIMPIKDKPLIEAYKDFIMCLGFALNMKIFYV